MRSHSVLTSSLKYFIALAVILASCGSEEGGVTGGASLEVLSPREGDSYKLADSVTISWESKAVANVKIELSRDDGNTWEVIKASCGAGESPYIWSATAPESTDNGRTWQDIANETTNTYSLYHTLSDSGKQFRCVVTNSFGSVTSAAAVLTVTQVPVIVQEPVGTSIFSGNTAMFTVEVVGSASLQYQWQVSEDDVTWSDISDASNSYLITGSIGKYYRCIITNSYGSVTSVSVYMGQLF